MQLGNMFWYGGRRMVPLDLGRSMDLQNSASGCVNGRRELPFDLSKIKIRIIIQYRFKSFTGNVRLSAWRWINVERLVAHGFAAAKIFQILLPAWASLTIPRFSLANRKIRRGSSSLADAIENGGPSSLSHCKIRTGPCPLFAHKIRRGHSSL